MFGPQIQIFRLLGFPIKLDLSWLFIAVLLTWSLAGAYFPQMQPELSPGAYWFMGLAGMLGLFASVVLHELGHAVVARRYDLEIRGITLFIFGGVAEMTEEPRSAKAEFLVAIGGPLVSLALAILFWSLSLAPLPEATVSVIQYLATINTILLAFNLLPAFPLDGGRVLRALIWHFGKGLRSATRITSRVGAAFGWILIGMGLLQLMAGFIVGAIWWALLGLFLKTAATSSYQQLLLRRLLEGERVSRFMADEPITVRENDAVDDLVEKYVYRYHHKAFPVVDESGRPTGLLTTRQIRELPRDQWSATNARSIMEPIGDENTIHPRTDALEALSRMNRAQQSRFLVIEDDSLKGILTLRDLLAFFSLKVELEEKELPQVPLKE
ncbi:MAG: site-2 protease family protein [Oceanipulchritudo sp.]